MSPADAVTFVAADALALPGVLRAPTYSGIWKPEVAARPKSGAHLIGLGHQERLDRMWELAEAESERDWGEILEPDSPYSENFPSKEVERIMRRNHEAAGGN